MKHKHAELIKAWADGAEIQEWQEHLQVWETDTNPTWFIGQIYRIKPEPMRELTDEEINQIVNEKFETWNTKESIIEFARAILKKASEK